MFSRQLETVRVNRAITPFFGVRIGGNGFFAAAELLFGFGFLVFDPLIHFNVALEFESIDRNREIIVGKLFFRFGVARHINRLAFIVLIDLVAFGEDKACFRFVERFGLFDCSAFVPEQKRKRGNKHTKSNCNPFYGIANSAKP